MMILFYVADASPPSASAMPSALRYVTFCYRRKSVDADDMPAAMLIRIPTPRPRLPLMLRYWWCKRHDGAPRYLRCAREARAARCCARRFHEMPQVLMICFIDMLLTTMRRWEIFFTLPPRHYFSRAWYYCATPFLFNILCLFFNNIILIERDTYRMNTDPNKHILPLGLPFSKQREMIT